MPQKRFVRNSGISSSADQPTGLELLMAHGKEETFGISGVGSGVVDI